MELKNIVFSKTNKNNSGWKLKLRCKHSTWLTFKETVGTVCVERSRPSEYHVIRY